MIINHNCTNTMKISNLYIAVCCENDLAGLASALNSLGRRATRCARGRGQDSGEEGESGVARARCYGCDVCALNVSSSFRHPIHAAHLLEERDARRIHAKQSPVALLDSNNIPIPTDAGKV